jgi:hypothetical protein
MTSHAEGRWPSGGITPCWASCALAACALVGFPGPMAASSPPSACLRMSAAGGRLPSADAVLCRGRGGGGAPQDALGAGAGGRLPSNGSILAVLPDGTAASLPSALIRACTWSANISTKTRRHDIRACASRSCPVYAAQRGLRGLRLCAHVPRFLRSAQHWAKPSGGNANQTF